MKAQLEPDRSSTLRSSRSQRCSRRPNAHQQQATARRTDGLRSLIVAEVSRSEAPCEREARRWSERSLARPLAVRPEKGPATADLRRWSQRQLSQLQAGLAAERRAAASSATTAATLVRERVLGFFRRKRSEFRRKRADPPLSVPFFRAPLLF